jgi:glycine reductase complex component B subunit gamma
VISKEIENAGIPTALITTLVDTALALGAHRIVPGCAITHPVGNPAVSAEKEREIRRAIVREALESLVSAAVERPVFA